MKRYNWHVNTYRVKVSLTSSQVPWLSATQSTVTVWWALGWMEPNAGYRVNMPSVSRVWPGPPDCSNLHTSNNVYMNIPTRATVVHYINFHRTSVKYGWMTSTGSDIMRWPWGQNILPWARLASWCDWLGLWYVYSCTAGPLEDAT